MLKAVILAAGRGNRISGATDVPKPLLPLNGREGLTFLDWHIRCLRRVGAAEIYLVGNKTTYGTELQSSGTDVHWILNPSEDLSTSGSAHSAWYAFRDHADILDNSSLVLLMDADIVYSPDALTLLLEPALKGSATLVYPRSDETGEEVLVFAKEGIPVRHGKGLAGTCLSQGLKCLGEATGIIALHSRDHDAIAGITDWLMAYSTAKTRSEHEDMTQRLMDLGLLEARVMPADYEFMEVDFPHEYSLLSQTVYPRLQRLLP